MMRQLMCLAISMVAVVCVVAQQRKSPVIPEQWSSYGIKTSIHEDNNPGSGLPLKEVPLTKAGVLVSEVNIGETRFDQQTNQSNQNRIHLYPDGSIGAVWCMGFNNAADFPDRGTGYNYFDGTSWAGQPANRIESLRTGWPSYAPYGEQGEIVVSHSGGTTGLVISKRTTKGVGSWTQSYLSGPVSSPKLTWPRVVTSGPNHDIIHILCLTAPVSNQGSLYQGQDGALLYYRSSDGGLTWDMLHHYFPGLDTSNYIYLGGDVYSWAQPKGDTLAFVMATKWTDVVLMKSTDGGTSWTKTITAYHPYPHFDFDKTIILDTVYVADGASSIALDNEGKAHILFGLMRINHEEVGDIYTFFPYTDGLVYWNEDMAPFQTMAFDTLWDKGNIIGYVPDWNDNDTLDLIWGLTGLGEYVLSLSGMPTITIDDSNRIFVIYSTLMENRDNSVQNYRHLLARASFDGGLTWNDTILHLTSSILHNYDECIFPSLSFTSNDYIHYVYQADEEPGIAMAGDEDPFTDNRIIYGAAAKYDFGLGRNEMIPELSDASEVYPNPFRGQTRIELNLSRRAKVDLKVYNLMGQLVWSNAFASLPQGHHSLTIDAINLKPGVYALVLQAGNSQISRKIIAY